METKIRKIVHLDMDAFYASVEQRDRPELRGKPVIVGGSLDRGVVSACSYEARAYGVRSAMAMARAVRLCPQAVVLPVRMPRYREVSDEVFAILERYTDRIEPLSIDEAFLDLSGCERLFGEAEAVAQRIREEVRRELSLAVSAGVAPNKFLAKLASEQAKPDGLFVVRPEEIDTFLLPLPLSRLWGVGKVTAERLQRLGLRTVADLRGVDRERLVRLFGSAGEQLYRLVRGVDERPVELGREIKSIGHEETFSRDLRREEDLRRELLGLGEKVARRLRGQGLVGRTLTLKVRYDDFTTVTRSVTLSEGLDHGPGIWKKALELLPRTEAGRRPVRLLGISLSHLESRDETQAGLFGAEERKRQASLDRALDRLRDRFGNAGPRRAALMERTTSGDEGAESGD